MRYIEGVSRYGKLRYYESIDDYVSEENTVRIIDKFVMSLDMVELGFEEAEPLKTGRMPYNPRDLLKLYVYGYMNGIISSRKLEAETKKNLEVIWLLRMLKPDFRTIADFRKNNCEGIKNVFKHLVGLCKGWGLLGKEIIAVDGTKFRASNSKKNNFNKKNLARKLKNIDEKITEYMTNIDENDIEERENRESTVEELKERIAELEKRKNLYKGYEKELEETGGNEISTVDPDSRRMGVNNGGIDVCYNVQSVVDSKNNLIVDCNVINNAADQGQLYEMSKSAKDILEVEEIKVLADKGYYNAKDLKLCESENITTYVPKQVAANATGEREFYIDKFEYDKVNNVYICPAGQNLECIRQKPIDENTKQIHYRNAKACKECKIRDKCTKSKEGRIISRSIDQDFLDTVDERTSKNKELLKKRKEMVEHPFGTIKRGFPYVQLLTRGLKSVKTEIYLGFFCYNFKRVIKILGDKPEIIKKIAIYLQTLCEMMVICVFAKKNKVNTGRLCKISQGSSGQNY